MNMLSTFLLRNRGRVKIRRAYLGLRVMSKSRLPDKIMRTNTNYIDMSNNLKEVVCIYKLSLKPLKIFPTVLVSNEINKLVTEVFFYYPHTSFVKTEKLLSLSLNLFVQRNFISSRFYKLVFDIYS